MRQQIRRAMSDSDGLVIVFDYTDKQGKQTRRVASPIRFETPERFLALCLSREEPRMFQLERISQLRLARAHEFLMPVPLLTLESSVSASGRDVQSPGLPGGASSTAGGLTC